MTLIIGVYPDLFLNPTMDYYENVMFQGQEGIILPAPSQETTTTDTGSGVVTSDNTGQSSGGERRRLPHPEGIRRKRVREEE